MGCGGGGSSGDNWNEASVPGSGLIKISEKGSAVGGQAGGLQSLVVLAKLPTVISRAGMDRLLAAQVAESGQMVSGFPACLDETAGVKGGKTFCGGCPALIEAVIGERFAQGGKAGFETIDVLNPEFGPLAQASAGIEEAAQIDHGIGQIT